MYTEQNLLQQNYTITQTQLTSLTGAMIDDRKRVIKKKTKIGSDALVCFDKIHSWTVQILLSGISVYSGQTWGQSGAFRSCASRMQPAETPREPGGGGVINSAREQGVINSAREQGVINSAREQGVINSAREQGVINSAREQGVINSAREQGGINSAREQGGINSAREQGVINSAREQGVINSAREQGVINSVV